MSSRQSKEIKEVNLESILMDNRKCLLDYKEAKSFILDRKSTKEFGTDDYCRHLMMSCLKRCFKHHQGKSLHVTYCMQH